MSYTFSLCITVNLYVVLICLLIGIILDLLCICWLLIGAYREQRAHIQHLERVTEQLRYATIPMIKGVQ